MELVNNEEVEVRKDGMIIDLMRLDKFNLEDGDMIVCQPKTDNGNQQLRDLARWGMAMNKELAKQGKAINFVAVPHGITMSVVRPPSLPKPASPS